MLPLEVSGATEAGASGNSTLVESSVNEKDLA